MVFDLLSSLIFVFTRGLLLSYSCFPHTWSLVYCLGHVFTHGLCFIVLLMCSHMIVALLTWSCFHTWFLLYWFGLVFTRDLCFIVLIMFSHMVFVLLFCFCFHTGSMLYYLDLVFTHDLCFTVLVFFFTHDLCFLSWLYFHTWHSFALLSWECFHTWSMLYCLGLANVQIIEITPFFIISKAKVLIYFLIMYDKFYFDNLFFPFNETW